MGIFLRPRGPLVRLAVNAAGGSTAEAVPGRPPAPPPAPATGASPYLDGPERLVRLYDAGAIDDAEFAALKARVMWS